MKLFSLIVFIFVAIIVSGCTGTPVDSDGDGWTDEQELTAGTDPNIKDTDDDGYWDSKDGNPLDKNIPVKQVIQTQTYITKPTATVLSTPIPIKPIDGKIMDVEFSPPAVRAGEKLTLKVFIANTGTQIIKSESIEIKYNIKTFDDNLANLALKTMSEEDKTRYFNFTNFNFMNFTTWINPGATGEIAAVIKTFETIQGRSLAGLYDITINLSVNGKEVDSIIVPKIFLSGVPRKFTST